MNSDVRLYCVTVIYAVTQSENDQLADDVISMSGVSVC